jgi:hypothetical protein
MQYLARVRMNNGRPPLTAFKIVNKYKIYSDERLEDNSYSRVYLAQNMDTGEYVRARVIRVNPDT